GLAAGFVLVLLTRFYTRGSLPAESCYKGKPSSSWGKMLSGHLDELEQGKIQEQPSGTLLGKSDPRWSAHDQFLWREDPAKIPVLIDLLSHPNPKVRMWVIAQLGSYSPKYRNDLKPA